MNLFIFRPIQFGPHTYIVMSENKEEAVVAVKKFYEKENNSTDHTEWGGLDSKTDYGEPVYEIEIYEEDQVTDNCND